jgi:hypothetical protein
LSDAVRGLPPAGIPHHSGENYVTARIDRSALAAGLNGAETGATVMPGITTDWSMNRQVAI